MCGLYGCVFFLSTRIMEVDQGNFTPVVVTVKGVMGPETSRYQKTLAEKFSSKTGERTSHTNQVVFTCA